MNLKNRDCTFLIERKSAKLIMMSDEKLPNVMDFYSKCHKSVVLIFEQIFYEKRFFNFSNFSSVEGFSGPSNHRTFTYYSAPVKSSENSDDCRFDD